MARKIFSELGVENVEALLVDWDALIPGLNAGRFDVVSAGMSILPERCEQAAFSDPEIMYTTALMVQEGNPKNLTDLDSVVAAEEGGEDIKLAVLSGGHALLVGVPAAGRQFVADLRHVRVRRMTVRGPLTGELRGAGVQHHVRLRGSVVVLDRSVAVARRLLYR